MTTFLFPGQGSQAKGMGENLFPHYPEFVKKADQILGYSIVDLCLTDPLSQLHITEYTQPAIFIVNTLHYIEYLKTQGHFPDFILGHSLGEYNALFAANVFDFETGLKIVMKRAKLMGEAKEGGMLAIIGLSEEIIQKLLQENNLNLLTIANINSYKQIIVSGDIHQIKQGLTIFNDAGATRCIPLRVSGAFHSSFMQEASKVFLEYLKDYELCSPTKTVITNVSGKPYDSEDLKKMLALQMVSPVQWLKSIEYIISKGENRFIELGYGNSMTKIIDQIKNEQ